MEEQGCQVCWERNTFPSPLEEFEGAAVAVCVVPSSCCLAAKGDFLQSNRNFNRCLRGSPAGCFAPRREIPSRVSSAITGAVQSGRRLHQDKMGGRSRGDGHGGTHRPHLAGQLSCRLLPPSVEHSSVLRSAERCVLLRLTIRWWL